MLYCCLHTLLYKLCVDYLQIFRRSLMDDFKFANLQILIKRQFYWRSDINRADMLDSKIYNLLVYPKVCIEPSCKCKVLSCNWALRVVAMNLHVNVKTTKDLIRLLLFDALLLPHYYWNSSIYNIMRWFAGMLGQKTHLPNVWCSKHYFFSLFLIDLGHSKHFIFTMNK